MLERGRKLQSYLRTGSANPIVGAKQRRVNRRQSSIQMKLRPFLVDPYKQTLIDLKYFGQELQSQDLQYEVIVMIDVNQDEDQQYCDQGHTPQYTTSNHFHVDGLIDGSLHTFMGSCGLRNTLREFHRGVIPNTHMRGSKQIDFGITTSGLADIIKAIGLLDCSVLNNYHCALFIDLCMKEMFGPSPEKLVQPQPQFETG
jgi:hypothetical protein